MSLENLISTSEDKSSIPVRIESYACTHIEATYSNGEKADFSGFFASCVGKLFLVTNWHCLSGRRSDNREYIKGCNNVPVSIKFTYNEIESCIGEQYKLIKHCKMISLISSLKPVWLVHNEYSHNIDVCAINLTENLNIQHDKTVNIDCGNMSILYDRDNKPEAHYIIPSVAEDIFILSSLKLHNDSNPITIWKRGSIASEPWFYADNKLPFFYVDSATREGMSGSPVIYFGDNCFYSSGHWVASNGNPNKTKYRLAGVYSGRDSQPKNESDFQLGRVWRYDVVQQILACGVRDDAL